MSMKLFLLMFQREKPMIHLLYGGMSSLLVNVLKNFVSKKVLHDSLEGEKKMRPVTELFKLDLEKQSNLKALDLIELRTKAKTLLSGLFN